MITQTTTSTYGPFPLPRLTTRQTEILDYIKQHICEHGYAPTVREIGKQFGIRSPNGVACHLKSLEKKERIVRNRHASRSISIVGYHLELVPIALPFDGEVE